MIVYFNGNFMDKQEVKISPDDRGFLFADGLYEVVRSYRGTLFRARDHFSRLNHGAVHLRLKTTDFFHLETIAKELLIKNSLESEDATIYFQVTRGAAKRSHAFPDPAPGLTVYAAAAKFDPRTADKKRKEGVRAISIADTRWARCDMKTTALTANILANQAAAEQGAEEAVFVRDGVLMEGSHSNFMAVFENVLFTAPLSNYILGGITRKFILELCCQENIQVAERPIFEKDIHLASEMMILGTTTEVTPIVQMNDRMIGNGKPGIVATTLQAAFTREIKKLTNLS